MHLSNLLKNCIYGLQSQRKSLTSNKNLFLICVLTQVLVCETHMKYFNLHLDFLMCVVAIFLLLSDVPQFYFPG